MTDIFLSQRPAFTRPASDVMLFNPTAVDVATFNDGLSAGAVTALSDAPALDMQAPLTVAVTVALTDACLLTLQGAMTAAVSAALIDSALLDMRPTLVAAITAMMSETGLLAIAASLSASVTAVLARTGLLTISESQSFNASAVLSEAGQRASSLTITVPVGTDYTASVTCDMTALRALAATLVLTDDGSTVNTYNEEMVAAITAALSVTLKEVAPFFVATEMSVKKDKRSSKIARDKRVMKA